MAVKHFIESKPSVLVIDDFSKLLDHLPAYNFYESLLNGQTKIILVSSQEIYHERFNHKKAKIQAKINELPQAAAIRMLQSLLKKKLKSMDCSRECPSKYIEFMANRLWFISGGNLREVNEKLFSRNYSLAKY